MDREPHAPRLTSHPSLMAKQDQSPPKEPSGRTISANKPTAPPKQPAISLWQSYNALPSNAHDIWRHSLCLRRRRA
ncbi:hypothetical protein CALVIDRAFT_542278 [Calocera viscosa TUFC12733]|uniref:Uncharacterized protein n=1 Tax=Calocera viscosa (strain TUFC12733) TaxID=1330018 RepID=A0A167GU24_CALVF|nr:hypothetical protein CALVIDRAFT_542278 [Calocera viscosa TUFC12733]